MKVLVCGGRTYKDVDQLCRVLAKFHQKTPITLLVNGAAPGADSMAQLWAEGAGVPTKQYPANWDAHGNAAGPLRNQKMLVDERPNMVIAFPGGKGTGDMISRALAAGIPTAQIPRQSAKPKASTYRAPRMT